MTLEEEQGEAIEKLMDANVPGWRDRKNEFETFQDYCNWIRDCVNGLMVNRSARIDH